MQCSDALCEKERGFRATVKTSVFVRVSNFFDYPIFKAMNE